MARKVSRDRGYRSDTIAISRDMGPLRLSLRAKGTLISEPLFSTPCEMRFFSTRERENGLFKEKRSAKNHFPFLAWEKKKRISQGVENRGSLISVPLALRVLNQAQEV